MGHIWLRRLSLGAVVVVAGLAMVPGMATAQAKPRAAHTAISHHFSRHRFSRHGVTPAAKSTDWTLAVNFPSSTEDYFLEPLVKSHKVFSGSVFPPNTSCPGDVSGSISHGTITLEFTYPGTPCDGDTASAVGKFHFKKGTASGTFTNGFQCIDGCSFVGTKT
jgi:hypothetical protein